MCGRYYNRAQKQEIAEYFHSEPADDQPFPPTYNIAPTTTQPVIRHSRETGARELLGMRWGLVGFGSKGPETKNMRGQKPATFNARADSLEQSGLWRIPLHKRRCLVPLSGFYEWRKSDKVPFRFTMRDQAMYALAGLWDAWKNPHGDWLQSYSIITVEANPTIAPIHNRMPAILHPRDYDEWLDRETTERPPIHLLRPWPDTTLEVHHANPKVGNVRNQDIDLLDSA